MYKNRQSGRFFIRFTIPVKSSKVKIKKVAFFRHFFYIIFKEKSLFARKSFYDKILV